MERGVLLWVWGHRPVIPSTWEEKAGGLQGPGQPCLQHSESLSQSKPKKQTKQKHKMIDTPLTHTLLGSPH